MRNSFAGWTLVLIVASTGFACESTVDPVGQLEPVFDPDGGALSSPERDAMIRACQEACRVLPECTPPETLDRCSAGCDDNEAHDQCFPVHSAEYECMSARGYTCIGWQRATTGDCQTEYRAKLHCEALASTPPGGEALRAACHSRCAGYGSCSSDSVGEEECKWFCDRDVGNTFPECVVLATAAAECEINAYSCVDGDWVQTNPYPCDNARFASEACHRRALKCAGADENGDCPTVSCTCYGQPVSYNRPEIIGKTCSCPSSTDCMRTVCPY